MGHGEKNKGGFWQHTVLRAKTRPPPIRKEIFSTDKKAYVGPPVQLHWIDLCLYRAEGAVQQVFSEVIHEIYGDPIPRHSATFGRRADALLWFSLLPGRARTSLRAPYGARTECFLWSTKNVYRIRGKAVELPAVIEETISRIEERLHAAESLTPQQRAELQDLLAELRREARTLPPEVLQTEAPVTEDAQGAISRLEESLAGFEASHPQLTGVVNRISTILANMGI